MSDESPDRFSMLDLDPTPLDLAIRAIMSAPDREALASVIIPLRSWPEGPDKDAARKALRTREAQLKSTPPPIPQPKLDLVALAEAWRNLFGWMPTASANVARVVRRDETARAEVTPAPVRAERTEPTPAPVQVAPEAPRMDVFAARRVAAGLAPDARMRPVYAPSAPVQTKVAPPVATRAEVRRALSNQEMVAGAKEAASGIGTGWAGLGELTYDQIVQALAGAGFPESWAPARLSDHFHASAALNRMANKGRIVRAERGRANLSVTRPDGIMRRYVARWTMGNPTHGKVGDSFGRTSLTAGLTAGGTLDLDGPDELVTAVREEYERRRAGGGVYPAGEITEWLRGVMIGRFDAVKWSLGWYVPQGHAEAAERLLAAVAGTGWGEGWALPAMPMATCDQLRIGLARGLASDARAVLGELETARRQIRKSRPGADVTPETAAGFVKRVAEVYERAVRIREILGEVACGTLVAELRAVLDVLEPIAGESAQRFAMMDLYEVPGPARTR